MPDIIELEGRRFTAADQMPAPQWPCVVSRRPYATLTLKDDDLFLITDTLGSISSCLEEDIDGSLGFFCRDTRFLSRLELQLNGLAPMLLSSTANQGFILSVLCANPPMDGLKAETIGIQREVVLNGGLFEELTITNYGTERVHFELSMTFEADFVDLFEVRGAHRDRRGTLLRQIPPDMNGALDPQEFQQWYAHQPKMSLAYQGLDGSVMESRIEFVHQLPNLLKGFTAIWQIELASHQTQQLGYRLQPLMNGQTVSTVNAPVTLRQAKAAESMEEEEWRQRVTRVRSDNRGLTQIIERAEQDLYLLRQTIEKDKVLSAGVPWFSTLFGRDSIIAAAQTLILDPVIARDTLMVLAQYQGRVEDDWREEEPGKILHELRMGEMARCGEIPHTPYYGTVDATPLWLILYADYYAWTHDRDTLERLWSNALAAMDWIDRSCRETVYLRYQRRSKRGLKNQGWKDSGDCIVDRQGEQAVGPIALCEVQGYVYAAKLKLSEVARMKKRIDLADRWEEEARELKTRFNYDFWMPDQDFYALALDGDGKPVDSITSNPGHCLGYGILLSERTDSVAERLQAPDMFSGWGIRTLSSLSPAYNPMGYHLGSVWPHDNSIIAMGLRSLGRVEQALEIAQGIMDMTLHQPYQRPPELFCGYERLGDSEPVRYPVACSPQAWASGAIFQLVQTMINLVPDAHSNQVRIINPTLPESIQHLYLENLQVGGTLLDLEFERIGATTACRVTKKRGNLRVMIEA